MPDFGVDHLVGALRSVRGEWRDAQKRPREPAGREFSVAPGADVPLATTGQRQPFDVHAVRRDFPILQERVRKFINAPDVNEVIFVRGTTEAINLVAKSWGMQHVGEGDEIIVSHLEHHANIVPWQQLASAKGAKLRVIPVDDSGQVLLDE